MVALVLVLSLSGRAADPELGRFARFPTPGTDLVLLLFQTSYSYAVDAEDLYPVVVQLTREGIPVWSQIATVDPAWPFLNLDCKVAWSPDFKFLGCSYRTSRATDVIVVLNLTGTVVKQQTLAIDDLRDSVLETSGDVKPPTLSKAWAESLEIGNDGVAKVSLKVAHAQTHEITARFDGRTGELKNWQPVPPAAK